MYLAHLLSAIVIMCWIEQRETDDVTSEKEKEALWVPTYSIPLKKADGVRNVCMVRYTSRISRRVIKFDAMCNLILFP